MPAVTIIFILILAGAAVQAVALCTGVHQPAEDAAMLMRYASNLAAGHGIRWNPGDAPVDGATDFGFMVAVAALRKLGLSTDAATLALIIASHFLTICVTYFGTRRFKTPVASLVATALIAFGPGIFYARAYFATPAFGLAVALTWVFAMYAADESTPRRLSLFAGSGLAMSLIRPEGVLLFVFIAVVVWMRLSRPARPRLFRAIAIWFLPIAAIYFIFHWVYFGYPLPNPFYKKGGGRLFPSSLLDSVRLVRTYLWPTIPLFVLLVLRSRRLFAFFLGPAAAFGLVWLLLSNETNYLFRFQYPVFILVVLSIPALVASARAHFEQSSTWRPIKIGFAAGAAGLLLGLLEGQSMGLSTAAGRDSRAVVGRNLAMIPGRRVLATTEAGLVPYYSGWHTFDLWGLNNSEVAHHGLSKAIIDRASPDLLLIHWVAGNPMGPWQVMAETARNWAVAQNYVLAASYGPPDDTHLYFVRPGPDEVRLSAAVRVTPYDRSGP